MMKSARHCGDMRCISILATFPAASSLRSLLIAAATTAILSIYLLAVTIVAEGDSIRYVVVEKGRSRVQDGETIYYDAEINKLGGVHVPSFKWNVGIACYEGDDGGVAGADLITSRLVAFAVGEVEEFDTARQSSAADEQWANLRGNFLKITRIGFEQSIDDSKKKKLTTQMAKELSTQNKKVTAYSGDGDLMGMVYPVPIRETSVKEAARKVSMIAAEYLNDGFQLFRRVEWHLEVCKAFKPGESGIYPIEKPTTPAAGPSGGGGGSGRSVLQNCKLVVIHDSRHNGSAGYVPHDEEIQKLYKECTNDAVAVDWAEGCACYESSDGGRTYQMYAFAVGKTIPLGGQSQAASSSATPFVQDKYLIITHTAATSGGDILLKMAKLLASHYSQPTVPEHKLTGMTYPVNKADPNYSELANGLMRDGFQLYRLVGENSEVYYKLFAG